MSTLRDPNGPDGCAQRPPWAGATAQLIARLHDLTGEPCTVEWSDDAELYGVVLDSKPGDIIGAGPTEKEALESAIAQAEVWKQNEGRPSHPRSRFE